MEKHKEWIAIFACFASAAGAHVQGFGHSEDQTVIEEKNLAHREAILDVREKIDFLYRRVSRLENSRPVLPPGPGTLPLDIRFPEELDAGVAPEVDVVELDEIDETPEEVKDLFGPPPEEKEKKPEEKVPEMDPEGMPVWEPIDEMHKK